jgi:hypothetical protein
VSPTAVPSARPSGENLTRRTSASPACSENNSRLSVRAHIPILPLAPLTANRAPSGANVIALAGRSPAGNFVWLPVLRSYKIGPSSVATPATVPVGSSAKSFTSLRLNGLKQIQAAQRTIGGAREFAGGAARLTESELRAVNRE